MKFDIKKIDLKAALIDFVMITIGAFVAAAAVFFFLIPSKVNQRTEHEELNCRIT